MRARDIRSFDPIRYGAYICLSVPAARRAAAAGADVPALAERLGLRNEYDSAGGDPPQSIAYLRRVSAVPGQITDAGLLGAEAIMHVAAMTPEPVTEFRAGLGRLLGPAITPRVLAGAVRPLSYTSQAMSNFAYGERVLQQPGPVMPNAFLVPVSKTAGWWHKDWMERHTYFLPRYDDAGIMRNQGHALAAAAGISCLLRRTYKSIAEPAPAGDFDFVSYFECADADVPVFRDVCDALRDVTRNPEWAFVREGPTWHGRRTATWAGLFK
ncbi:MAG TPA: hypothetical protein VF070_39885 [Streptosporangiaceae bacterium]